MAFYVSRKLNRGPIRFSVDHRRSWEEISGNEDLRLSTDTAGRFLRLGDEGLYFSENVEGEEFQSGTIEHEKSSLWAWILPERNLQGVLSSVSIVVGLLLLVLGIAVLTRKGGAAAIFEIVLGLGLVIGPVVVIAQKNRLRRMREAKEREERREIEARNREIVGAFAERLKTIPEKHDPPTLAAVRQERSSREIPYDAVAPLARRAVLGASFDALRRYPETGPRGVAAEIDEVADAVGLNVEDARAVRADFFQTLVWHLLADDRMNDAQEQRLKEFREALDLRPDDVQREERAIREFHHIRGIRSDSLPETQPSIPLKFQEACFENTSGKMLRAVSRGRRSANSWRETGDATVHVTSKRMLIGTRKQVEIPRAEIFELEVDYDRDIFTVRTGDGKRYDLELPDPIYTAAIANLSRELRDKPAGLI